MCRPSLSAPLSLRHLEQRRVQAHRGQRRERQKWLPTQGVPYYAVQNYDELKNFGFKNLFRVIIFFGLKIPFRLNFFRVKKISSFKKLYMRHVKCLLFGLKKFRL